MEIILNVLLLISLPMFITLGVIKHVQGLVWQFFLTVLSVFALWILFLWGVVGYIDIDCSSSFGITGSAFLSGLWMPAVLFFLIKITILIFQKRS